MTDCYTVRMALSSDLAGYRAQSHRRPSAARDRIVAAAARLMASASLHEITMRSIAAEAAVSPVSLYRHFQSVDEVWAAVGQVLLGDLIDSVWRDESPGADLASEQTRRCLRRLIRELEARPALARSLSAVELAWPAHRLADGDRDASGGLDDELLTLSAVVFAASVRMGGRQVGTGPGPESLAWSDVLCGLVDHYIDAVEGRSE